MASSNEVNAPSFFSTVETLNGLDRVRRYVQSKLGDLGFQLANNIDDHLLGRKKPDGSQQC